MRSMTDAEHRAFEAGYVMGFEAALQAQDDLLVIAAERAARVAWVADRHDQPELLPLAVELDKRINAAMTRIRAARFEDGVAAALHWYELERAIGGAA